uniref:Uncharacterized protein n=1 Tax=Acrobeloides nanus TaxID=290746 RepID=A0A914E128_9BILA
MMRLFEETHVGLHLPWWQTFIFATVLVRVCFFGMSMIMAIPFNKQGKLHAAENMYHFIDLCSVVLPIWAIVKMNALEYPGLAHGGTLWFENLMQIDRYLVFPVTGLDRKYIKINMDKLGDPPSKFFHKWFLINTAICLPILMGTMYLSAGASLSFLTSSVCAPFFLALRGHYAKEQNYQTREDMLNMMKLHFKGEPIPPKKKLPKRVQEIIKK